jgi:hypothetical protein
VLELVVKVNIDGPDPAIDAGLKLPVVPVGSPETLSATLPLNEFSGSTNIFG